MQANSSHWRMNWIESTLDIIFINSIKALRPLYSFLNIDLSPLFHFVLNDSYIDLQQFPPQRNHTNMIKVCHIAAFHTTKKSRWSNNILLYIPNSPRSLTLTSSPSQLFCIEVGKYLPPSWKGIALGHLNNNFPVLCPVISVAVIPCSASALFHLPLYSSKC